MNGRLDGLLLSSWAWRKFVFATLKGDLHLHEARPARILDLGGGFGASTEAILELCPEAQVFYTDPDARACGYAERHLRAAARGRVSFHVCSATALPFESGSFDAVVAVEVLHHIPKWREALREVRRVLAPGGSFYVAEALDALLRLPVVRTLFPHPQESHFDAPTFARGCSDAGLLGPLATHGKFQIFGALEPAE